MLGPREVADGKVAVKDLVSGKQLEIPRAEVAAWLQTRKEESV
jgi:histidyl-tRNA synthetase